MARYVRVFDPDSPASAQRLKNFKGGHKDTEFSRGEGGEHSTPEVMDEFISGVMEDEYLLFVHMSRWSGLASHAAQWSDKAKAPITWVVYSGGSSLTGLDSVVELRQHLRDRLLVIERPLDALLEQDWMLLGELITRWIDGADAEALRGLIAQINQPPSLDHLRTLMVLCETYGIINDVCSGRSQGAVHQAVAAVLTTRLNDAQADCDDPAWWSSALGVNENDALRGLSRETRQAVGIPQPPFPIRQLVKDVYRGTVDPATVVKALHNLRGILASRRT
jgi:hypothetical protein